jgi:hypothetical protein
VRLGIGEVATDGSERLGTNCVALGAAVEGDTNDGSERFGASPDTFGTEGEVSGATKAGSARFGTDGVPLGADGETAGDIKAGSERLGASPDTFDTEGKASGATRAGSARFGTSCATLGTDGDAVDDPKLGRPTPLSGVGIEGEVVGGSATVGTLALEAELAFASTAAITLPRGTTPRMPGTILATSPT